MLADALSEAQALTPSLELDEFAANPTGGSQTMSNGSAHSSESDPPMSVVVAGGSYRRQNTMTVEERLNLTRTASPVSSPRLGRVDPLSPAGSVSPASSSRSEPRCCSESASSPASPSGSLAVAVLTAMQLRAATKEGAANDMGGPSDRQQTLKDPVSETKRKLNMPVFVQAAPFPLRSMADLSSWPPPTPSHLQRRTAGASTQIPEVKVDLSGITSQKEAETESETYAKALGGDAPIGLEPGEMEQLLQLRRSVQQQQQDDEKEEAERKAKEQPSAEAREQAALKLQKMQRGYSARNALDEMARRQWMEYYVAIGDMEQAAEYGWDPNDADEPRPPPPAEEGEVAQQNESDTALTQQSWPPPAPPPPAKGGEAAVVIVEVDLSAPEDEAPAEDEAAGVGLAAAAVDLAGADSLVEPRGVRIIGASRVGHNEQLAPSELPSVVSPALKWLAAEEDAEQERSFSDRDRIQRRHSAEYLDTSGPSCDEPTPCSGPAEQNENPWSSPYWAVARPPPCETQLEPTQAEPTQPELTPESPSLVMTPQCACPPPGLPPAVATMVVDDAPLTPLTAAISAILTGSQGCSYTGGSPSSSHSVRDANQPQRHLMSPPQAPPTTPPDQRNLRRARAASNGRMKIPPASCPPPSRALSSHIMQRPGPRPTAYQEGEPLPMRRTPRSEWPTGKWRRIRSDSNDTLPSAHSFASLVELRT